MRVPASLLMAAIILGAFALPAPAAPAAHAKAKSQIGIWEIVQGEFAGRQTCMAIGAVDESTILMLKLDTGHMANHVIALLFTNAAWSIKEGDDLGEFEFKAGDARMGASAVAGEHGFFVYMSLEPAQDWFDKTRTDGFSIHRNGHEIARYRRGNLAQTFRKIRACGEKLVKADPFADRGENKPASRPTQAPPIIEAAVIPPKPIDLGHWIKAIEKDYFAGPPGNSPAAARAHEMRNSHPASIRFKISVNASGEMTNCEVIGTNGLPDWALAFCAIAMRHSLKFAPAQTASGKAVAGDYVNSADVRFEDY